MNYLIDVYQNGFRATLRWDDGVDYHTIKKWGFNNQIMAIRWAKEQWEIEQPNEVKK
jgi:hypothetical protein